MVFVYIMTFFSFLLVMGLETLAWGFEGEIGRRVLVIAYSLF